MEEKADKRTKIVAVAENQKSILLIIFLRIILIGFYIFYALKKPYREIALDYVPIAFDIALGIAAVYYIALLLRSMNYSIVLTILFCFSVFIPGIWLIVVFLLDNYATNLLKDAGLQVGLLGVSKENISVFSKSVKYELEKITSKSQEAVSILEAKEFSGQNQNKEITSVTKRVSSSSFRTMAKLSCIFPLAASVIHFTDFGAYSFHPVIPFWGWMIIAGIIEALVISGFLLSIISFFGVRKRGVFSWAILGFILCITIFVAVSIQMRKDSERKEQLIKEKKEIAELRKTSFLKYPGLFTEKLYGNALITVYSYHDSSPYAAYFKSKFQKAFSFIIIQVDNRFGDTTITINPSSLQIQKQDNTVIKALPTESVLNTAYKNKSQWLKEFTRPKKAMPGDGCTGMVFLPEGTDLSKTKRISITMDGRTMVLKVRYMTPQEKWMKKYIGI